MSIENKFVADVNRLGLKSVVVKSVVVEASSQSLKLPLALLLTDRHLESFEDFEVEIDRDYSIAATKASRRRQLGK